ncbi:hypothetical protein BGX29_005051 [Mortierella sp. GBA35]|nr:hypothetical protein BGX29_005051 [Mortierella sp. GBA35]
MTAGSGSAASAAAPSSSSSSSRRRGRDAGSGRSNSNNYRNNDVDMTTAESSSSSHAQPVPAAPIIEFPRAVAQSLKPSIATFIPHNDVLVKGLHYITEATIEYEEFHGSPGSKGAGLKDSTNLVKRPPTSRTKAVQAAYADQMAFSSDPQIHSMEDALLAVKEMQYQMEAEKQALERLTSMVAAGVALPVGASLQQSYEQILKDEMKHIQARRKQEAIATVGMNPDLQDFRTKVWEVHHSSSALPTSAYGEDEDNEDMEIVVTGDGNNVQSLKCPLTTNFLEDPVTSSLCKHSFSNAAIRAMIQSRPNRSTCPVHGCNRSITLEMLQPNKALARKVARQIMLDQEMFQRPEEETL